MRCIHCGSEWNVSSGLSMSITNCPFCGKALLPEKKQLNTAEDVLVEIHRLFGLGVLTDEAKLVAYFSDLAPQLSRQRRILGYFVECGGPKRIAAVLNSSDHEQSVCIKQIVREMKEEMFIEEAASQMICDSFLFAVSGRKATEEQCLPENENQASGPSAKKASANRNSPSGKVYTGHKSQSGNGTPKDQKESARGRLFAGAAAQENRAAKEPPKNDSRKKMTVEQIRALVNKYDLKYKYLVKGSPEFEIKILNAINAYAAEAAKESPMLLEDHTIFGSAKEGFVLTAKTVYYCLGAGRTGRFPLDRIVSVSVGSYGKLYSVNFDTIQNGRSVTVRLSYTSDKQEAEKLRLFWRELLQ